VVAGDLLVIEVCEIRRCMMTKQQKEKEELQEIQDRRDLSEARTRALERSPSREKPETAKPRKHAQIDESGAPVYE